MRTLILLIILSSFCLLNAAALERFQDIGSGINARMENLRHVPFSPEVQDPDTEDEFPNTPVISKTMAFPYHDATLQINQMVWRVFDRQGNYQSTRSQVAENALTIAHPFTFREMRGVTLKIQTQIETEQEILTLDVLDFNLQGSNPVSIPTELSPAFIDAYKALADNWDNSYLRQLPLARPKMLIISHSQLGPYQTEYIKWKRSLGMDVYVINKSEAGNSIQEIRNTILNHYQQYKCDYLFLWGDTVGTYTIPTNFYPSPEYAENDADDQYYALLEGDDYFPEMLVGRFSFNAVSEFLVMAAKTIKYEREPFMTNTNWMKRALVVAGNYAEGELRPITPVQMSRWLRDKMLAKGYAQVDSVFYPHSYPGTSLITSSINQGVQMISYRGWGDANGWHYPSFHNPDLDDTFNGAQMPIVFSIVCNTGDFANSVNPSFGEKWMRMGTTANLGGCVAFVGPSDLHTKTRLNNSISSGAFRSILDYGVRGFGSSVLMGKIELYKNFPNDIAPGQYVPFYYHVYNLLSDPSLNMWVLEPNTISESIIEGGLSFSQATSHIRINAPALNGAMVSGTKDGINFSYARIKNDYAILPVDPNQTGDLTITVSKPNNVPLMRTLTVNNNAPLGITGNSLAGSVLNASGTLNAELTLKNFSEQNLADITATLQAPEGITITPANPVMFDLMAGATHNLTFQIQADHTIHPSDVLTFSLVTTNPGSTHLFQLNGGGPRISVWNHSGTLTLGQTNQITFTAANIGSAAMTNAQVQAYSLTEAATVSSTPVTIGAFGVQQDVTFTIPVTIAANAWEGRNIPLKFIFTDSNGYEWMSLYSATAGSPSSNDPTGPCEYGYYAYDNSDTDYAIAPVYEWVETDPLLGGQANVWLIMDDGSKTVPLPFTFRFYGRDYDSVTICSNGWISFIPTTMEDFYNYYIPAALGPYAMVAGYWDDLKGLYTNFNNPEETPVFADMRVLYWHDVANNRYIIQWNEAYNQYTIQAGPNASLEKFQIILYPKTDADGDIVIQYHTVDNPGLTTNFCTVGIEDHNQLVGLTYTHGNVYPATAATLAAGRAIKFTTVAPDNYVSNEDPLAPVPVTNLRNFPNPFNPSTTISFEAKNAGLASLEIFNLKGQIVRRLFDGAVDQGVNSIVWNGNDDAGKPVATGVYLYRLNIAGRSYSRKMLMLK